MQKVTAFRVRAIRSGERASYQSLRNGPQTVIESAPDYQVVLGQVGAMDVQKIIAAIETAARRENFIGPEYAEEHALYHAVVGAWHGMTRGQIALEALLRTVGLRFSIVERAAISRRSNDGGLRSHSTAPSVNPSRAWNMRSSPGCRRMRRLD
jgi:hypothetical protein